MRASRIALVVIVLLATFGALASPAGVVRAADRWAAAAAPPSGLGRGHAALLPDGQVFMRGYQAAGRYDPVADRWTTIQSGLEPRDGPAIATLHSGDVLIIGGRSCGRCGASNVERYDPHTGTLNRVADLLQYRARHTATTLGDGRVLVTGGSDDPFKGPYASTELYDPATDTWTVGPPMAAGRLNHTATLLVDGRVLVVGDSAAEVYDPATGRWSPTGTPVAARARHTATLLPDGGVLVVGGDRSDEAAPIGISDRADGPPLASVERYDPASNRWRAVAPLPGPRAAHSATALDDGQILVVGGRATTEAQHFLASALRFDPATQGWHDAGMLSMPRSGHAATLLLDGRVLVAGGGANGTGVTADLYIDTAARICAPPAGGQEACASGRFLAYWREHGGLAINGHPLSAPFTETLEDGRSYVVQYFERVRLEYHHQNPDPQYRTLLGQFGRRILADVPAAPTAPTAAVPGATYFAQTGHNVTRPEFAAFWSANGGLAQFGFPLSEEFTERLEDGAEYRVQYFERARFEWHPANTDPHKVQLGQFGRRMLEAR